MEVRLRRVVVWVLLLLVGGARGRGVTWRRGVRCSVLRRGGVLVGVGCWGAVGVCWAIPRVVVPGVGELVVPRCWGCGAVTWVGRLVWWVVAVPLGRLLGVWLWGVGRRVGPWAHNLAGRPVRVTFGRSG